MVKLGNLKIGEKTSIVGVIAGEKFLKEVITSRSNHSTGIDSVKKLLYEVDPVKKLYGGDILELRIDRFDNLQPNFLIPQIKDLRKMTNLPLIATIRRKEETDFRPPKHILGEKERLNLFKQVIPFVDGIDIELQAKEIISPVINFTKEKKKTIIISYHNFKETPGNEKLEIIVKEAKRKGADIIKIATYAKKIDDVARLLFFTYQCPQKPLVSISLGKIGSISRIIGSVFGSCLTYAFLGEPKNGQLSIRELVDTINFIYGRR